MNDKNWQHETYTDYELNDDTSRGQVLSRTPRKQAAKLGSTERWSEPTITVEADATATNGTPVLKVLDDIDAFVQGRLDLTRAQQTAICLWIAHTYIYEHFKHTPKLFVTAIKHGLGKSECLEVVEALSCGGIKRQGSTTSSAISRMYDTYRGNVRGERGEHAATSSPVEKGGCRSS
jgi:hypothetical protein